MLQLSVVSVERNIHVCFLLSFLCNVHSVQLHIRCGYMVVRISVFKTVFYSSMIKQVITQKIAFREVLGLLLCLKKTYLYQWSNSLYLKALKKPNFFMPKLWKEILMPLKFSGSVLEDTLLLPLLIFALKSVAFQRNVLHIAGFARFHLLCSMFCSKVHAKTWHF